MTATEAPLSPLAAPVAAAAAAALGAVSGADTWTATPAEGLATLDGARAARLSVGTGSVALVVDGELARHLQVGPPPAEDFLDGCRRPLEVAVGALSDLLGGVPTGEPEEVEPAALLAQPGMDVAVAAWVADGQARATLVVSVASAASSPPAASVTGPQPEPAKRSALSSVPSGLELLHDVEMGVTAELGRTRMQVKEILDLQPGSVIELDRAAGSPVDVLVNGTLIARGEVVVIDEEFGIRITEVLGQDDDRPR